MKSCFVHYKSRAKICISTVVPNLCLNLRVTSLDIIFKDVKTYSNQLLNQRLFCLLAHLRPQTKTPHLNFTCPHQTLYTYPHNSHMNGKLARIVTYLIQSNNLNLNQIHK